MISKFFGKSFLRDLPGSVFVFSFLVLLFSIFIAVTQVQKSQTTQSRADVTVAVKKCTVSQKEIKMDSEEKKFIGLLNNYRKKNKLSAVKEDATLTKAAAWMSNDMATKDYFDHTDSLRRTAPERLSDCGHSNDPDAKENIANSYETADEVMRAWQKSKDHDKAMKNGDITIVGVARHFEESSQYGWYWTLDMGSGKSGKKPDKKANEPTAKPGKKDKGGKRDKNGGNRKPTVTQTPTETPAPEEDTSGTSLKVSIKVPGITGGKNNTNKEKEAEIFLFDLENNQVANNVGTLIFNGSQYTGSIDPGSEVATGTYIVKVKLNNTLRKNIQPEFQKITAGEATTLPTITLYQGDFDGNNRIDLVDFNIFIGCLDKGECPEETLVDLNEDGEINTLDHSILLEAFFNNQGS